MSANIQDVHVVKRLRGAIVEIVYQGHREQRTRMDAVMLWGVLRDLQYDVSENEVITQLQDLKERHYLDFLEERLRKTGEVMISKIQITPGGRDLVEGTVQDLAVLLK